MTDPTVLNPHVVIVGAGPSGLTAAARLAPRVDGQVLVLEREAQAGGIPRHSDHFGYGIRDRHTFITGPAYARRLRDDARDAGAVIMTEAMATGWAGPTSLDITSPQGRSRVDARAVILATGARERPSPARLIPGDRGHGVYTTGTLQNIVHLKQGTVGKHAVVIGAELVSWSAVMTLRHVGCRTELMTTEYPKPDSYALFHRPGRVAFRTRIATRTRLVRLIGRPHVTAVELENLDTRRRFTQECDTVILTGDWIPDNELARSADLSIDPVSKSPLVDTALRTEREGIFAIGNLLHPVDTADIAALDGTAVADPVLAHLDGATPAASHVQLTVEPPLRWVAPALIRVGDPAAPRHRLLTWTDTHIARPTITLTQGGKAVASKRLPWPAAPGRVLRIPASILSDLNPHAGDATLTLT